MLATRVTCRTRDAMETEKSSLFGEAASTTTKDNDVPSLIAKTASDVVAHIGCVDDDDDDERHKAARIKYSKLEQESAAVACDDTNESGEQEAMNLEETVKGKPKQTAEAAEEDVPEREKLEAVVMKEEEERTEHDKEETDMSEAHETLEEQQQHQTAVDRREEVHSDEVKLGKEAPYQNEKKRAQALLQERQKKPCSSSSSSRRGGHGNEEEEEVEGEDVCYICFDGGELVTCDRRSCPKAYHLNCIGRDAAFFRKKGAWICGWHFCSTCTKTGSFQCYMCPIAYCGGCVKDAGFVPLCKRKGLCEECFPIVIMIDRNQTVNSEGVEVNFEDKETYEYMFKEYWFGLKNKLSLTMPELDEDGKPAKGNHEDAEDGGSDTELQDPSDIDGLGTASDRAIDNESDQDGVSNLDWGKGSRKKIKVAPSLSENLVTENKANAFTEGGGEDKEEEENAYEQEEDVNDDDDDDNEIDVEVPSRKIEGWASKEVLNFIVHMNEDPIKPLTRSAVNHLISSYINQHQLQDPTKKNQIICDEQLQVIFGKKVMGQSDMYRQLQEHFPQKNSVGAAKGLKEANRTVKDDTHEADGAVADKLDHDSAKHKRRGRRRSEEKFERPDGNDFAAITPRNIDLIYLRRALLEHLLEDPKFESKVVDTFVRIRVPGNASTSETCYRLVLVTGTRQQGELYRAGRKKTNVVLEVLNLQTKEDLTIDLVSNQDFNEEECQQLQKNIKCGFIKRFTVGQLEAKAMDLQEAKVIDWFETERQRLVNLRDRASEQGRKKELREYVEKLEELSNPAMRAAKLRARPEVSADPHMGPGFESNVSDDKPVTDGFSSYRSKFPPGNSWEKRSVAPYNRWDSSNIEDSSSGGRKGDWGSHRYKHFSSFRENNVGSRDWSQKGYETGRSSEKRFGHDINLSQEKSYWNGERGEGRSWIKDQRDYIQEPQSDADHADDWRAAGRSHSDHWVGDRTSSRFAKDEFQTPVFDQTKSYQGHLQRERVGPASTLLPLSNIVVTFPQACVLNPDIIEKEKIWHYKDPTGTLQGPFSMEQLRKWNTTGLFPIDLRITRTGQTMENSILLTNALTGRFTEERDSWRDNVASVYQRSNQEFGGASSMNGLSEGRGSTWGAARGIGDERRWDAKQVELDLPSRTKYWASRDPDAVDDHSNGWPQGRSNSYGSSPASGHGDDRGPSRSCGDSDSWVPPYLAGENRGRGVKDNSGNSAGRSSWGRYSGRDYSYSGSWNEDSGSRDRSYSSERSRGSKSDITCRYHAQGYCRRGDSCVFRHV